MSENNHTYTATETSMLYPWVSSYPDGIDWNTPLNPRPLYEILDASILKYSDHTCTDFMGKEMPYKDIGLAINRFAGILASLGVKKGSRIGISLPNCPIFIIAFFAILKCGATVVNFNPLYTKHEVADQVKDADVDMIITVDLKIVAPKIAELVNEGVLKSMILCSFTAQLPFEKKALFMLTKWREIVSLKDLDCGEKCLSYDELMSKDGTLEAPSVEINPEEDFALFQYTGGTTGKPKAAMLTHANLSCNCQQIQSWFPSLKEGKERILVVLPLFHVFSLAGAIFGLANGFELVLLPRFDIGSLVRTIRNERPTIFLGVPTLFSTLNTYRGIKAEDFKTMRYCVSGGAALDAETRREFEKMSDSLLVEGYGLSETSPVVTINPFEGIRKNGSIGQPLPKTQISIRSLEDPAVAVEIGQKGEICVKGPQVMKGYWNNREETERAFTGDFFRTGDVGYMDGDGFVYVVDRIKDMINSAGYKIYPRQVEDAILEHQAVLETTVIGIPHKTRGEAPKAYVCLKKGQSLTEEELRDHLKKLISKVEMPEEIEFRDEIPKTMIGKHSKKALREENQIKEEV